MQTKSSALSRSSGKIASDSMLRRVSSVLLQMRLVCAVSVSLRLGSLELILRQSSMSIAPLLPSHVFIVIVPAAAVPRGKATVAVDV
mgnify:CR=1 FL=1